MIDTSRFSYIASFSSDKPGDPVLPLKFAEEVWTKGWDIPTNVAIDGSGACWMDMGHGPTLFPVKPEELLRFLDGEDKATAKEVRKVLGLPPVIPPLRSRFIPATEVQVGDEIVVGLGPIVVREIKNPVDPSPGSAQAIYNYILFDGDASTPDNDIHLGSAGAPKDSLVLLVRRDE